MKITIVGGGNVGTLISAQLTHRGNQVTLYTRDESKWKNEIIVHDNDDDSIIKVSLYKITSNLKESIEESEMIIITLPAMAQLEFIKKLEDLNINNKIICFYPGTGGGELISSNLLKNNNIICGTQRICSVVRLEEYGHSVQTTGKRKDMFIGCIPQNKGEFVKNIFEKLFEINTILLPNYLNVTLTPSNPILHPSRLYTLFKDYYVGKIYDRIPLFYEEWNIQSSETLIKCDEELHNIINTIDKIDLVNVRPLLEHYESTDAEGLKNKIQSIKGFKNIGTPSIETENGYVPDFNSRYFTADIPYGLLIIKSFALITKTSTPMIDEILFWYQSIVNKKYITKEGNLDIDSKNLHLPQNYGIDTIEKIYDFYLDEGSE